MLQCVLLRSALFQSLLQHYIVMLMFIYVVGQVTAPPLLLFTCHLINDFLDEQVCIGGYAISHRFTCMVFSPMNMFVLAVQLILSSMHIFY